MSLARRHHFLPQGLQRLFADDRGLVAVVDARTGRRFESKPINVAVEGDLYLRTRPTGEKSDDIEKVSLGTLEQEAFPIIQEVETRWPLSGSDKVRLAAFLGIQLVRGPRWFAWHEKFVEQAFSEYLEDGSFRLKSEEHGVPEEEIFQAHVDAELDETRRLLKMLFIGAKAASSLGSMRWSLVHCDSPRLAISDHPVVAWPASEAGRPAGRALPEVIGLLNFFEVRMPLSPTVALLMSWQDLPDNPIPIEINSRHACNLNAFSIAEAERHWLHLPASKPKAGGGRWLPLAPELLNGYSLHEAAACEVRGVVLRDLNERRGDESRLVEIRKVELPKPPDLLRRAA